MDLINDSLEIIIADIEYYFQEILTIKSTQDAQMQLKIAKIFELFNINSVPVFMHVAADKIRFNDKFNDVPLVENLVKWINNRANLNVCCRKSSAYMGLILFSVLFSYLLSIFRAKIGSYQYSLFFK